MPKSDISKNRVKFPPGVQRKFIRRCSYKLGYGNKKIAEILSISVRSITDWKREKFLIPLDKARMLSRLADIAIPRNARMLDKFWYVSKGAQKGGLASYKKQGGIIGDPRLRKQKWYEWWERDGKLRNNPMFHPLSFTKPRKSASLAEFIGIMMGDGGMSQRQISIALHHKDDLEYSKFVIKLIESLFLVKPSVYHQEKNSVNRIVVSRIGLVFYLHSLGLPIGDKVKQKFDIPHWIKENRHYLIACMRGLMDTDGCLIVHRYRSNNKLYAYKKLAFTSASRALIDSVFLILKDNGLHPRFAQNNRDVRIDSKENVARYFKIFGSSNPKHLLRYAR